MLNITLIKSVLIVSLASSILTTSLVQKIKENLKSKKYIQLISFVISMIIGPLFALTFSKATIIESLWIGLICFIGADTIYKTFEDKIFSSFSDMNDVIEVPKENNIRGSND